VGFLRLILALAVARYHFFLNVINKHGYAGGFSKWVWLNGGFAVMLFNVISGFLMSYVLANKYPPTSGGNWAFYRSRLHPHLLLLLAGAADRGLPFYVRGRCVRRAGDRDSLMRGSLGSADMSSAGVAESGSRRSPGADMGGSINGMPGCGRTQRRPNCGNMCKRAQPR
jgi:hypothetical protein